ncbi:SusC/RagA family TonB-linked outer membrane protein [Polaribacter sargassicola]|uniref:SusC/RagA family TonB-linked outer membrane protein n=1 Tax=Polaribacter sargassicola TaxID=2836891 RepID=UPI001F0145C5|nr:SusC/RagA family TonB-linked outer membrane protein [Polaribacter sp. DS7-9]MCG1036199.1 SusC/RagA family TonB-linked outer membrane protein [Polaribacter sp. DS7-9]
MKTKSHGILTLFMAFLLQISFAQEKTISGTIKSGPDPLPGVSITIKGTSSGVETDFNGKYSIKAKIGDVLVFRFLGYTTTERKVGKSNVINLSLTEDANVLEEVVVVGYGSKKRVSSIVGSAAAVTTETIVNRPTANVMDALQGQVAGFQVYTSSGEPSATPSFRLHGNGSLGAGSTPLIIMDGVPIRSGTLVSLNPRDFESVTILKDASATSIYGSRAANGVVVITTKKGSKNGNTIDISTQYGVSNIANTDFYENFMNSKELTDFWLATGYRSQEQVDALLADGHDTEWYKYYYKENAPTIQADLAFSGGSEKSTYYVSLGLFNQEGLAYRSDYDKYTFRANIDSKINDWSRFGTNLSFSYDETQTNNYGSNSTNRGLALLAQPFYSPYDENGDNIEGVIPGWGRYNPRYLADNFPSVTNKVQVNPTAFIEVEPIENLILKTQAGIEFYDSRNSSKRLPSYIGSLANGYSSENFSRIINTTVTNTLQYSYSLKDIHNFSLIAGQETIKNDYEYFYAYSAGQNDDRLTLLSSGPNNRNVNHSESQYIFSSYFTNLEYNYDKKYYGDISFRRDGSSRFGKDNKYANFWAAGVMWDIKKEDFMQDITWLNELKFRTSYGTSGNSNIGNYESLASVGTGVYEGNTGWFLTTPGNSGLTWEEQKKLTSGLTFGLFEKATLSVEYYNRRTTSMLIDVPQPYTTGWSSITSNVGELENAGVDITLNFDIIKNSDLHISPYVTFNYNKEKIIELFQDRDYWIIPNTGVSWIKGQPRTFFRAIFAGINSETGAPEWYVPGDDITKTTKDPNNVTSVFNAADLQQSTGQSRYAPVNGGFGLNAGYKGFNLQVDFSFSSGKYLFNNDAYFFENPTVFGGFNQSKDVLDYWQQPGDVTTYPSTDYQFTQFDSRLIENASFLRMKNISFGYQVPTDFLPKNGFLKSLNLYITGRNLLTFTKYTGPDPEVDSNISLGANPNTKQITFGVDIKL